jgi:hypothetical protein
MAHSAKTAVPTPYDTESNSSDFHKIAIFLQSREAIVTPVALLTGRVYQDGLGGLRAVLFIFGRFFGTSPNRFHPKNQDMNAISGSRPLTIARLRH